MVHVVHTEVIGHNVEIIFSDGTSALYSTELLAEILRREGDWATHSIPDIRTFTLDSLPKLTPAQLENLKALAARPDSEIDTSDIPEITDEQWKNRKWRN